MDWHAFDANRLKSESGKCFQLSVCCITVGLVLRDYFEVLGLRASALLCLRFGAEVVLIGLGLSGCCRLEHITDLVVDAYVASKHFGRLRGYLHRNAASQESR